MQYAGELAIAATSGKSHENPNRRAEQCRTKNFESTFVFELDTVRLTVKMLGANFSQMLIQSQSSTNPYLGRDLWTWFKHYFVD